MLKEIVLVVNEEEKGKNGDCVDWYHQSCSGCWILDRYSSAITSQKPKVFQLYQIKINFILFPFTIHPVSFCQHSLDSFECLSQCLSLKIMAFRWCNWIENDLKCDQHKMSEHLQNIKNRHSPYPDIACVFKRRNFA